MSADATFKLAKKARIVAVDHTFDNPLKGGLLSAINEDQEIVTFVRFDLDEVAHSLRAFNQRLCQTQAAAELTEMLESYVRRCEVLGVASPEQFVVDNCCAFRNAIAKAMPNAVVVLDVWHFKMR